MTTTGPGTPLVVLAATLRPLNGRVVRFVVGTTVGGATPAPSRQGRVPFAQGSATRAHGSATWARHMAPRATAVCTWSVGWGAPDLPVGVRAQGGGPFAVAVFTVATLSTLASSWNSLATRTPRRWLLSHQHTVTLPLRAQVTRERARRFLAARARFGASSHAGDWPKRAVRDPTRRRVSHPCAAGADQSPGARSATCGTGGRRADPARHAPTR